MLWYILGGLAALLLILLIVIAMRPNEFRIERSDLMNAPPAKVFEQVNNFHKWDDWSPWAKLDPNCRNVFEGAPAGQGAGFFWDGNQKVGSSRMTITESRPNDLIRINLQFYRPFAATNTTEYTFVPEGSQTRMTWSMSGRNNFMSKAFGLFCNMDKMVGTDFEKGLAAIKAIVEKH
jgi:uncharacterized protein YndB with AHSA1/START domain